MIKTFDSREEALSFFEKRKSAILRREGQGFLVFTPASEAVGHPTTIAAAKRFFQPAA